MIIENQTFDEERALYGLKDLTVKNCCFDGPADGESAFKECRNIDVAGCFMNLRYPFWHVEKAKITMRLSAEALPSYQISINKVAEKSPFEENGEE